MFACSDEEKTSYVTATQASFNTMQYKGRNSAFGIDRKLPIIRPGTPTVVGSMTTKGQMHPKSRVSITSSQAKENSQTNGPEHTIVSRILTDLIFKGSNGRRAVSLGPPLNQQSSRVRSTSFNFLNLHISPSTPT